MLHEGHVLGTGDLQPQGVAWINLPSVNSPVQALNKVFLLHLQCHTDGVCSGKDDRCVA